MKRKVLKIIQLAGLSVVSVSTLAMAHAVPITNSVHSGSAMKVAYRIADRNSMRVQTHYAPGIRYVDLKPGQTAMLDVPVNHSYTYSGVVLTSLSFRGPKGSWHTITKIPTSPPVFGASGEVGACAIAFDKTRSDNGKLFVALHNSPHKPYVSCGHTGGKVIP